MLSQGRDALKYLILAFPLVGFQVISATLFQATGKARQTLILSLARQLLFLIPLVLIMPSFFGLKGIWMSFPIADTLGFCLSVAVVYRFRHLYYPLPSETGEDVT